MTDLKQAFEYLKSYEADKECRIKNIDAPSNSIFIQSRTVEFALIAGAYIESTWGIRVVEV